VYDLRASGSDSLPYCLGGGAGGGGVGGDASCTLQLPLDAVSFSKLENVEQYMAEMPHNCISLSLSTFTSVSQAIEVARKARLAKWPVTICVDTTTPTSTDSFLSDFAVGVGAGSVVFGGVLGGQFLCKYNRLLEISIENPEMQFGRNFRQM
jgi:enolase